MKVFRFTDSKGNIQEAAGFLQFMAAPNEGARFGDLLLDKPDAVRLFKEGMEYNLELFRAMMEIVVKP